MGWPSSVSLAFNFYLVVRIGAVTSVTRKVNHDRLRPTARTFVAVININRREKSMLGFDLHHREYPDGHRL